MQYNTEKDYRKLDPVGSTVRYEMMKLCTGSVKDTMRQWQLLIDDTGSVEGIYAFIYCTKWRSGQVSRMFYGLTRSLTNLPCFFVFISRGGSELMLDLCFLQESNKGQIFY